MAGEINFSGLASGLDTSSIIEKLMTVERQPVTLLENKQSNLASQRTKLLKISGYIQTFKTAASDLSKMEDLDFFSTSSNDESVLGVSTSGRPPIGTYSVEVTSVAQADRNYSAAFGADAIGLQEGDTLDITIDGVTSTVTFEADDTLADVAQKINDAGADAWATVVGDGEGGGRLLVASSETGAAQHITFGGTASTLLAMSNVQLAVDTEVVIDDTVVATSSTRSVEGVLDGLTFEAREIGTTEITVESDDAAIKDKVQTFVNSYNNVMASVAKEFAWTGESRTAANLSGDSTLRSIQRMMSSTLSSVVTGLTGKHTTLSSIGITSLRDGTLEVDEEKLDAALTSDIDGVKSLFASNADEGTFGIAYRFVNAMDGADRSVIDSIIDDDVGSLSIRIEGIDERTESISESIERMETRLTAYEGLLKKQFTAMEQMISSLQSQSSYISNLSTSSSSKG
jgi:flagellar hook-associated protein 2